MVAFVLLMQVEIVDSEDNFRKLKKSLVICCTCKIYTIHDCYAESVCVKEYEHGDCKAIVSCSIIINLNVFPVI